MEKERKSIVKLHTLDDLFSSEEMRADEALSKIREIPLDEIDPFPNHPFHVKDDDDMIQLSESIRELGVLTPATVRKKDDGRYELLSGHRRKRASELAGLSTLRCEVVDMDRDEATIFMVDSNLQRTTILPSEKAFSYRMRLEAMNRQGKRSDLTSTPVVSKSRSNELLGQTVGESREQIRRYIRLTELIPELLDIVDHNQLGMRQAVEISYLSKELQTNLFECIQSEVCMPTHAQTIRMRKLEKEGMLTEESIYAIMQEEKPNQQEKIILRSARVGTLIPKDVPVMKREAYVVEALEYYAKYRNRDLAR